MKRVFKEGIFADVTIKIGGRIIKAHKAILKRSKVLYAMIKNDQVFLEDLSYDMAYQMIRFLYCDEIENADKNTLELVNAARKYDILLLVIMCKENLRKQMSKTNVVDILLAVEKNSECEDLKQAAVKFIAE
jgi:hypothetical protein